ncbi:MAG TPA: UDP-N-acetylglucosamine 2-epimerase (non-hydrolyzing) [Actinobacteria bacterium]|nr:UDP-N-acetylglucosamine 2-epimerase (non-hydrolyzing) [Actinomycetota bacterium]HCK79308.1 UDP-N-acetylglucosamine 2-epimerase (non-hydrolyzing) [Actinomycetota bacterium]
MGAAAPVKPTPILHVTGARPNFPKAAPVIAALATLDLAQTLVHTGQHYDDRMSEVFFRELGLPTPDINLGVGSGSHAVQTAAIMVGLEELMMAAPPELVVVYGDVNSTVAAALVAAKLHIPVAHVEAGLRSFDMTMPEEVNRRLTDQLSDLLLVTSRDAIGHLEREGIQSDRIHFVGNPMIDTLLAHLDSFDVDKARRDHQLTDQFVVATLHRPGNVDDEASAQSLVRVLHEIADRLEVVFPLHPRGRARLEAAGLSQHSRIRVVDPLGYTEFISLVRGSAAVVTDSGGVQEETTVLGVPCLTLRPNTERPVTITDGTNQLVTVDSVVAAVDAVLARQDHDQRVPELWDGSAGVRIAAVINNFLQQRRTGLPSMPVEG